MKKDKIIKELDVLDEMLEKEQIGEAQNHIKRMKNELIMNKTSVNDYIDELVDELK